MRGGLLVASIDSKAHWRHAFATMPKAKARRIARATPGGRKTRYRQLPARRPGRHVVVNATGTGYVLKAPRYGKTKRKGK